MFAATTAAQECRWVSKVQPWYTWLRQSYGDMDLNLWYLLTDTQVGMRILRDVCLRHVTHFCNRGGMCALEFELRKEPARNALSEIFSDISEDS